jgi:hypothetical protein
LDEVGERREPSVSFKGQMKFGSALDLAEKFEQRPHAEAMEALG